MSAILTHEEWKAEGMRRFGRNVRAWAFTCPCCKTRQTVQECLDAGVPSNTIGFSCIGRWSGATRDAFTGKGPGPCNYAGGGLFRVNPVIVAMPDGKQIYAFAFAEPAAVPELPEELVGMGGDRS